MNLDELLEHYAETISTLLSTISDRALNLVPDCLKDPSFYVASDHPDGRILIQVFSVNAQPTISINGVEHQFQASEGPIVVSYSADRSLEAVLFPQAPEDAVPVMNVDAAGVSIVWLGFSNREYAAKYWSKINWNALAPDEDEVIPFRIGPNASVLGVGLLYGYELAGERQEESIEYVKAFGDSDMLPKTVAAVRDDAFRDFFISITRPQETVPTWSFTEFLAGLKASVGNNVLLLGSYHEENVYEKLKQALSAFGYAGFMLRDSLDLAVQTNMEKLYAAILCSSFIIVVDDEPSGHIAELAKLLDLNIRPTIIVRREGRPATRFLEDSIEMSDMFMVYDGPDLNPTALAPLIKWARNKMRDRGRSLNEINRWRDEGVL